MKLSNRKEVERMILQFSCSNHKSIKDKVTFSMLAGSDNTFEEMLIGYSNLRVLRSAVIYGANGSGKSNFISALSFMCKLVRNSIKKQPGEKINQKPHKLSEQEVPSEYDIQFLKNDIRYAYGFSIVKNAVSDEYLYYYPKRKRVKIFERDGMEINPGDKYKNKVFDVSTSLLKENRLFLSCAANYTNKKEIEDAFLFFKEDVVIYRPDSNNWKEYSINLMQKDAIMKERFIHFLKALGTGVSDIKVNLEKIEMKDLPENLPDKLKEILTSGKANRIEVKMIYEQFETDLLTEESTGIKKLFEIICPILDIIQKGKILICDEFETGLHESVVHELVRVFHTIQKDGNAQLIFSTHDTSLLDSDLFRRDQIWFTQLDEHRCTDLYSLIEIKDVRKTENLERGYVTGKYGAIPMLNKNFLDFFKEEL